MTDSTERTALVAGAGQGLGKVYAHHLAGLGFKVVVADLNGENAKSVAQEIDQAGGTALAVTVDVSDEESVAAMVDAAVSAYGSVDVLVNNAAIFSTLTLRPFEEISLPEWQKVLSVNINGPFLCCKAVSPHMRRAKWGRIINISSAVVRLGVPHYLHYVTSKSALIGMSRSLARELGMDNITVNVLSPGGTVTEIPRPWITEERIEALVQQQSLKRRSRPEDLASVVAFLASDASSFITGQELVVDGGLTFG